MNATRTPTKTCRTCGTEKPLTDYSRDASKRDGHDSACKTCRQAYMAEWYERNRDQHREKARKYRTQNRDQISDRRKQDRDAETARTREYRRARPHYSRWAGIRDRCLSEANVAYPKYGGRGITMHPPWIDSYETFADWIDQNLGPCPDGHSLDRINNDGNYEPGNLRWADAATQARNRRERARA